MVEFWRCGGSSKLTPVSGASAIEAAGWDGQMFLDSQSIGGDPYVKMGAWAARTERLMLGTGVTNPMTRHPAVTASAIATVQSISGGRAVLGMGRGDSALAFIGYAPTSLSVFHRALLDLQTLLSGGEIAFGEREGAAAVESLSLGHHPEAAKLNWLDPSLPKVPLDVAATGPKVIAMCAPLAERVTFSVGAIPDRMQWALDIARAARAKQGLGDDGVSYGAQVIVVCSKDIDGVRAAATSFVAPLARFQVMLGEAAGPLSANDAENFAAIRTNYDMTKHGEAHAQDKLGSAQLSWDFVRRFAIVGPPNHCIERLLALAKLGVERFQIVGPSFYPEPGAETGGLFAREVIPAVRAALS